MSKRSAYPVLNLGAEHLAIALLMRRNIMAFNAPSNNQGYDLVCTHPDPRRSTRQLRVQVKSRIATDSDRSILIRRETVPHFDYLMVVYLNAGFCFRKSKPHSTEEGLEDPQVLVVPKRVVSRRFSRTSKWGKVRFNPADFDKYGGPSAIDIIAGDLKVPYPSKVFDGA